MHITCNMQSPKLKMHNRIYRIVSFFNTSPKIAHSLKDIHHYIVNLWQFCVRSKIRFWHDAKFSNGRDITIWALNQNDGTVWLKVQYLTIWYHIENLLHLYKSCLQKWRETWSWTFSKNDLYKWSRFLLGYQITEYDSLSRTFRPFYYSAQIVIRRTVANHTRFRRQIIEYTQHFHTLTI